MDMLAADQPWGNLMQRICCIHSKQVSPAMPCYHQAVPKSAGCAGPGLLM